MGTHRKHGKANPLPDTQVTGLQLASRRTYAPGQSPFPLTSVFIRSKMWHDLKGQKGVAQTSPVFSSKALKYLGYNPCACLRRRPPSPGDFWVC